MLRLSTRLLRFLVAFGTAVLVAVVTSAQGGGGLPAQFAQPMPHYPRALGPFTRPISSKKPEVQSYFDQGMQMMYAFDTEDAARSFREAEQRDPDCAICFWGEAWSWGSYLNAPMPAQQSPMAYAAVQKAVALAPTHATPIERALIEAMAVRYVEQFDPSKRVEQDQAYATAMRGVHEKYPRDVDVSTLYADALFLLQPRRGARDIAAPPVQEILHVLERALVPGPHVGACHLLIHLTEATTEPGRAEACADYIGDSIPGASHINHMPSHTWNEIGRWGDSVRANIHAWHSDQKADVGEGFAIYPSHNLHMLAFAASMDGQGAIAVQGAHDYTKMTGDSMLEVQTLIRFGRFDDVLAMPEPAAGRTSPITLGVWAFGHGYASLRGKNVARAREDLARVQAAAAMDGIFRFHSSKDLVGTLAGILEGEILRTEGNSAGAIAAFERAITAESQMIYDEPEPLMFGARHWLGAVLLDAGRFADAERVYREELEKHPHNGWSLFGLNAALVAQRKPAADVAKDLEASWARSDFWLRRSAP